MLFNAGNTTVTVSKARIVDSDGKAITLTTNTCDVAIGPGKGCLIAGPAGQFARACKFSTSAGDLRGSLVMYDSTDKPWQSIDLQQ